MSLLSLIPPYAPLDVNARLYSDLKTFKEDDYMTAVILEAKGATLAERVANGVKDAQELLATVLKTKPKADLAKLKEFKTAKDKIVPSKLYLTRLNDLGNAILRLSLDSIHADQPPESF